jgi:hypothetical protein
LTDRTNRRIELEKSDFHRVTAPPLR